MRGAALPLLIAASAILPARGDDLAITPATLPVATQMVAYAQTFTASGGSGSYNWSVVPWTYETAEPTYSVGANETPLWDGTAMKGNTAYKLPFTFTYCGTQYDTIYVDSHGFLMFDPNYSSSDYAYKSYLSYGYTGLAVLWKNYAYASGWVDTSVEGQVSFRFEMSYESGDTTNTWAHKTTLYSDGRIRFAYRQSANDSVPDNFAIGLAVGNMRADYSYASLPLAGDGDAIPSNDFVFMTYGIAEGFSWSSSYYDYSTYQYVPCLYGQSKTAGPVPFALKVTDSSDGSTVTNFYDFVIVENPDKEPVIDAVSPVTTNEVHELSIGDTMAFHVDAHDLAGDPFDIRWVFYRENSDYAATTNLGSGADFTFEATRALYDFQYSSGESVLKCIVSDAFWTNSVTWHIYIRRDTYIDASAETNGDGSSAAPYNRLDDSYLKCRDKIILAPGRYELDYMNLGSHALVFVSTGSMDDTVIAFTSGYSLYGNETTRSSFTGFTLENIESAYGVNLTGCSISGITDRQYAFQYCNLTGCYVWGCSVSQNLFTDSTLRDCTVAGNRFTQTVAEYDSLGVIGIRCKIENTIVANNLASDGSEANFSTDEWDVRYITATNCCTIPAMTAYGTGNYEADPKFVYPEEGDLRLRVGSGCLAETPANNTGAYKGAGVAGFVVHAFTDPVRGIFSDGSELQVVAAGETAHVMVKPLTDRAFLGWVTNGVEVAGATEMAFAIEKIDCDYEVEALFEYKEFYVNPTEVDDTGDGSAAQPKKSIAAAAALALEGETIRLAEGSYEPFALLESSKVTLLGAGPDKTFIDGGGTNWCVRLGSNATLKNVAVVNGKYTSWSSYAGGVTGGTIENCVVSNCVSSQSAGGIYNATVVSSLIVNNVNTNTSYNYAGYPAGVGNCEVYNSTIANNISSGYPGGVSDSYLKNCIVYGNTAKVGWTEYNEVSSCDGDGDIYDTNLIGSDPWFVNAANGDYRLIAGSPAIDVGENVPQVSAPGALDLAGDRRIRNGIVDYGCYEGGIVTGAPLAPVATGTSAKAGQGLPFVWSAIANAAEYRIYRGTSDDPAAATLVGTTTATNYLDLATTGGTGYFYWISAYNAQFGESEKYGPIEVTSYADLKIETASLPHATEAVPYNVQLECSGNTGAAEWSLPYTVVTREASTFDGTVGTDAWELNGNGSVEVTTTHLQTNVIVTLPFNFTWFGKTYHEVKATTFGGLYFGLEETWPSWSSSAIYEAPKIAVNEGPYTYISYVKTTGYSIDIQPDHVTIVWKGTCSGYTMEFSATLNSDNTIRLAYGTIRAGAYVAFSNGTSDTVTTVQPRLEQDCSGMDDIVIASLPNESGLSISADGVLSGIIDYAGDYRVTALVHDTGYGDSVYKTFTLTVDPNANTRPVIDSTTPAEGKVTFLHGDTQEFAVAAHDPEGAPLTYTWFLNDEVVQTGSSTNYVMTAPYAGVFTLACEVSDALWTNGQVYAEWDVYVGQKLYVDAASTAGDEADGTQAKPFKTLQEAVDWLGGGDTVFVAPGTYAPVRVYGGYMNDITFRATGSAAETIIDANGAAYCLDDYHCAKEFTFVGFTIRNGGNPNVTGSASYGVNLKNCIVTGFVADRCIVYGADVEDCQIYGNTVTRYGSAVGFCNATRCLIYNNTSGTYGAAYKSNLDHCTVYGNTAGIGGGMDGLSTATYSIIWGNNATNAGASATANYEPSTNGVQFTYSCTTPLPEGEGNIAADPLFVNAAGGDFHLADGSPCLAPGMGCYGEGGDTPPPIGVTYTITFDANGGTCAEATRTVAKGKAVGTLPTATRPGYTLKGWYTKKTDGTKISASTTVTKDVTYYAQWTALPKYTVTFNANGGTCATASRKVYQGAAIGELPEATRGGWDFVGWFTAKTGGAEVTPETVVTKAATYYARWTEHYELTIEEGVLTGLTGTTPATINVPATVTAFAANLFKGVTKITSVTGGANVTACGAGAFRDSGLWAAAPNGPVVVCGVLVGWKGTVPATVDVPAGVRVIADGAFAGATSLATVYLPDSLVAIGDGAFKGCTKLDDVFGLEDAVTVADNAFEDTLYATFRLTWSGTVVTGFKGPLPAALVIPANATGIGVGAFKDQTAITSLSFEGTNLTAIAANAFQGCTGLAEVELPDSLATIGASAFQGCATLATVTGGGSVETIRTDAFAGTPWYDAAPAEAFEEVRLGHVLVRMKGEVPASYEISTNVWMVADNAFAGVTTLSDLYIGTEVVSLWDRAFAGCTSLGSVTVPSGCRELGDYLFEGCTSLTNVFFRGHAPTNDVPHVFSGTPETLKVRIKEGSRGWIAPGSDSDLVPARWPYKTAGGALVPNDLNRAVADPEDLPGVVRSVIVDGTITNDTTWVGGKVYEVQSGCTVEAGATLTIDEGAIVKIALDRKNGRYAYFHDPEGGYAGLHVVGKLVVNGTYANPVVFTSITDDSCGGDTNGDGDRSEPYPGDNRGVGAFAGGSIEARYAKFLYGHATNGRGAHACVIAFMTGARSTFHGCEFSHAAMDGCFGSDVYLENCVITDCDRGLVGTNNEGDYNGDHRNAVAVNCVIYGNRVGTFGHTASVYVTNSIVAFNAEVGLGGENGWWFTPTYATRCCLWNPGGVNTEFKNSKWGTYNVDNIEADPLFLDAENGDFRISVESPCVDAAYGDVAPELDFWGQPRMDVKYVRNTGTPNVAGEYPDIGLYEVPGTTERPVMNLEVESVAFAPASAAPGETLTVTYTVRNTGNTTAKGSIRDVVRIKSAANGGTMTAGTVTQNYNLQAAETAALHATVTMPAAPAGEWLVGIDVNPNRDVFEQNFLKNSMWTEDAVEVTLQAMTAGSVWSANVLAGTTMGYVLADVPAEGGVVVITESGGHGVTALPVVARVAAGHMPTAVMNDATSFVRADGAVVIVVPAHPVGDQVYLAIENTGISAETVNVSVQELTTELWSVYPEIAANVGDMGFTFTGAGLTAESEFYLGGIKAKSVSVIDSANVYAVFDVQNIAADRYYDVSARSASGPYQGETSSVTIRDAVYINKKAKGPILEAKLELPDRTRDNRIYTGYVVYENTGDTQMNAPTFIVNIAEASSTNTVIGAYDDDDDNLTLQRVLIVGLGSSHPAGILKPGDSGRLPFKFKPVGSYQFKLDSRYTSDEVAGAVTRMNLRGGPVRFDGSSARGLANLIQKGEEAAAVSGWLLDSRTREPLANAGLGLTLQTGNGEQGTGNGEEPFVRTATTDENGYFSFEQLRDGAYQLSADVGYVLVTTNLITVAGQADVNGYEATALPPGVVTGYAMRDDGNPVQYGDVTLFAATGDMVGTTVKTDGYGAYRFTGLENGAYTVYAKPFESFRGVMVTNVVIEASGRERRIDMELKRTARAYGTVTMYGGGTAVDGEVRLYDDEGNFLKADVATNGVWEAAGIPVGEYSFAYVSEDGALDSARVVAAFAQGDEREIALTARPAIMFRASTRFGAINTGAGETLAVRFAATGYANNTNVVAVQWDFGEGDPVEVDEVETTHTYATTGYKSVRLRPKYADGTYGDWDETENYIFVSSPVETIYKGNAIVLQGFDDAGAVTNAGTLVVTGVGTNWLELTGTGGIPLEAGVVIAGSYTNAENEADWFVRKVIAVSGDVGGWRLATEYGDEDDLYEQYWSNWGFGAAEEEGGSGGASLHGASLLSARGPARLMSGDKKKGFGDRAKGLLPKIYGEGGVTFNVMCSPDITCFYSYYRLNIKGTNYVTRRFRDYHEMVPEVYGDMHRELRIFGDVSLTANIDISAEYSGGWKKEYQYDLLPKVVRAAPQAAKIIPHFTIKAEAAGKIGGSLHGEASVIGYIDVGFTKETGKKIQWHKPDPFKGHVDMSFETAGEKEASGKLHASVGAGFGVTMKVFEVLSATADVTFSAKAEAVIPSKGPSKASINIGYDTEIAMNFIDFSWLNADWKVGLDWSIEGLSFWGMEWISPEPSFIYRQPHEKEWPARITVTDRSKTGTFVRNGGRTEVLPIRSVTWDYGQGQTYSYDKSQIDNGTYKRHRIIEFNEEGEYTVSLNVQGGIMPNIFPCQKKIKIKKPKEDEQEEQTKIFKDEWFGPHQDTQTSVDPNAMEGPYGVGANRYVKPGQEMTYTIYFENKSDAAIAAQEVFVDNPLSEYLDWSTFRMGTVSVGGQLISGLDGYTADEIASATTAGLPLAAEIDQTNGLYKTRAEVMFDAATGVASWYIRVLDPAKRKAGELLTWPNDDTAGVLQPNLLPPDGEGYITYTVNVSSNAPANAIIDNSADIVFDKNPVIVTDPAWWNTVYEGGAGFIESEIEVDEGSNVVVHVIGGNEKKASSVKVYLTYNTAAAADLNLGKTKYPVTLKWAAGEIGEKTVTIPVKADTLVEGEEMFTLQLAAPSGMTLGEVRTCTVYINDAQWPNGMSEEEAVARGLAAVPAGAAATTNASGAVMGYVTKKDKKGNVTAKAMPGHVFTGWYLPNGKLYSTKATITDKERKAKKLTAKFAVAYYLRALADSKNGGTATGSGKYAEGKVVTLKATPAKYWTFEGWTLEDETGATPVVPKAATVKVTVTNDATYVAMFKPYPKVTVTVNNKSGGTVKGAGSYLEGKTATLKATPKKGYAFIGWYDSATNLVALAATYKYKVTAADTALQAMFKKESALAKPVLTWGDYVVGGSPSSATADAQERVPPTATNHTVGVSYAAVLKVEGESVVNVAKVTGLPKGLAYKSNKVTGVPTKAGKFTVSVTVALASNKKKTWVLKVPITVVALPAWAKGTYNGHAGRVTLPDAGGSPSSATVGLATITVGATGKISGKFYEGGTNWTLSAASYGVRTRGSASLPGGSPSSATEGNTFICSNLVAKYSWKVKQKVKGKMTTVTKSVTRKFVLVVREGSNGDVSLGCAEAAEQVAEGEAATTLTAYQNLWSTAAYKKVGQALFYTSAKNPSKTWASVSAEGLGEYDTLTLKVTSAGAVTATYKFFKGTFDAKTKKPQYATYTCTAVVLPTKAEPAAEEGAEPLLPGEWFEGTVQLFFPPVAATGFPGYVGQAYCPFVERVVPVPTPELAPGGNNWFTGAFNGSGDIQFPDANDPNETEFLNGLFSIQVATDLSFTGTFTGTDGTNATFSGTFVKDGDSYKANGVSITARGKTMSMALECSPGPYAGEQHGFGEISGGSEAVPDEPCIALNCAWQNIWARSDLAAEWKPAFAAGTEKTINLADGFLDNLSDGDSLTYSFGANGAVTVTGKIYGEDVNVTTQLNMEGYDSGFNEMHCNFQFLANGHLYQQQFSFPRKATVAAADFISLDELNFNRLD